MRYVDSGRRNPIDALGTWLNDVASADGAVVGLRWQSGFFAAPALGFLEPLLTHLAEVGGTVRVLVGSNDGTAQRRDLAVLLDALGPPRPGLQAAVVSFENAYFHPKTIHISRANGSAAAYVGSANLTRNGVEGRHIEAGVCLDTQEGDDDVVLRSIASAIDWWFEEPRLGLFPISTGQDLEALAEAGVIGIPKLPPSPRLPAAPGARARPRAHLRALITAPALDREAEATRPAPRGRRVRRDADVEVVPEAEWQKTLSRSDAQRKRAGNQRGSITLVRGRRTDIDTQAYFRREFFGRDEWATEHTRTGQPRERADIEMAVSILARDLGAVVIPITYAPNRESAQANYTTLLHLGPMSEVFLEQDLTGRTITLKRDDEGRFSLSIE